MEALRTSEDPRSRSRAGSASCSSSGARPPTCRARRATRCGAVQGGARRGVGALRGALRRRRPRRARENLAKKIALCERAEALADSTNWIQTADEIKALQAEWKTIGPVSRGQEKAIWERFRAACDRFFTRRHEDLAKRKALGREPREEGSAVRRRSRRSRVDRLGADRRRDQAAAGGVEDDRPGEEEPVGGDLAALPRRVRRVLRPLRAAPRHRARRTRRGARGDLRRARRRSCRADADGPTRAGAAIAATVRAPARPLAAGDRRARRRSRTGARARRRFAGGVRARHRARGPRRSPAPISIPTRIASGWKRSSKRIEELAGVARRRGAAPTPALSPTTRLAAMLKEALAANTIGGKVDDESRCAPRDDVRRRRQLVAHRPRAEPVARRCRSLPARVPCELSGSRSARRPGDRPRIRPRTGGGQSRGTADWRPNGRYRSTES